jgi:hypothetical protein
MESSEATDVMTVDLRGMAYMGTSLVCGDPFATHRGSSTPRDSVQSRRRLGCVRQSGAAYRRSGDTRRQRARRPCTSAISRGRGARVRGALVVPRILEYKANRGTCEKLGDIENCRKPVET